MKLGVEGKSTKVESEGRIGLACMKVKRKRYRTTLTNGGSLRKDMVMTPSIGQPLHKLSLEDRTVAGLQLEYNCKLLKIHV